MSWQHPKTVPQDQVKRQPVPPYQEVSILNKNRYWWKVQLPGETKAKARPLKPIGSKYATTDYNVAFEVATNIWQDTIYKQSDNTNIEIVNIASLATAYLQHVDEYYRDDNNNQTSEVKHIRYSLKPLVKQTNPQTTYQQI